MHTRLRRVGSCRTDLKLDGEKLRRRLLRSSRALAQLRTQAGRLGLAVFARALSLKELQEKYDRLLDEATALQKLEESDEGLDENQQARWGELFDEEKGELTIVANQLQQAKKVEGEKKRLLALRLAGSGSPSPFGSARIDDGGQNPQAPAIRIARRVGTLKAFRGESAHEDAFNSGMWLRAAVSAMRGRVDREAESHLERLGWDLGFNPQATQTEGDPESGGYLVPEPMQAAWIERREQVGVMRALATIHVMTSEKDSVPKLTSGPGVIYPGEAGSATVSDQVWGRILLSSVKRMVYGKISRELRRDALINIVDQFVSRTAYEMAKKEDADGIKGDGSATYGHDVGLLNALGAASKSTAATGHDTWLELDIADFVSCMGILPDDYWMGPAWLCSAAFYHIVMLRVMAQAGGNNLQTLEVGRRTVPMFLGYPVFFSGQMPKTTAASTTCCLFGDFASAIMLGDRQDLEVALSDDAHFAEDVTAIKATTRIDFNAHECGDASNAGAVVGLVTAS